MKQVNLFGEIVQDIPTPARKSTKTLFDDYESFTEKFKPKLTTDDCYTPKEVYAEVLKWLGEQTDLTNARILRPFFPGGDYEAEDYLPDDIVVDNPPFSMLSKIVRFYLAHNIRFFLFAPCLTVFSVKDTRCCFIPCAAAIVYENGAKVNTAFVTNLFSEWLCLSAPDLKTRLERANKDARKSLPKYEYPWNVITSTRLGYFSTHGIDFRIRKGEAQFISALDEQRHCGKTIFGSGLLITDAKAAKVAKAAKAAKEENKIVWSLSTSERQIIEKLNQQAEEYDRHGKD